MSEVRYVDFDKTLAEYHGYGSGELGAPIAPMVARVKAWLEAGDVVVVYTARLSHPEADQVGLRAAIGAWCLEHVGRELDVTNVKGFSCNQFWDDRAIQVLPNTGVTLADHLADQLLKLVHIADSDGSDIRTSEILAVATYARSLVP